MLGAGVPLKQLELEGCMFLDGDEESALLLLPELQHLKYHQNRSGHHIGSASFPSCALQSMQQLTYLNLAGRVSEGSQGLRHLRGLTRLQDLWLGYGAAGAIQTSVLAGLTRLTCLRVKGLRGCSIAGGSTGVERLLSNIQQLQQLTYLKIKWTLYNGAEAVAPAEAYSALTASSKLQHLDFSVCVLPTGAWQH